MAELKSLLRKPSLAYFYLRNLPKKAPTSKYVIFGRGRSGSTLLSSLLDQSSKIACDNEILFHYFKYPFFKIHYHETMCQKPVFGFKLLTYQLTDIYKMKDCAPFFDRLILKANYKLIYLERENLLDQAISNYIAFKSGTFHRKSASSTEEDQIHLDIEKILMWLHILTGRKELEQRIIKNYDYLHIKYERDLLPNNMHQDTIDKITGFLGVSSFPISVPDYKKIVAKKELHKMIVNYDHLNKKLSNSPFEKYL